MKRKKQWFAVILAAMLVVGQGIISAAPAEDTAEAASSEAYEQTAGESSEEQAELVQTEENAESVTASASEVKQETVSKTTSKKAEEAPKIGGGYFRKEEINPFKG